MQIQGSEVNKSSMDIKWYFIKAFNLIWIVLLLMFPLSVFGEEDVLKLLIWEGHAPKLHVEKFQKHIAEKYGRSIQLKIVHPKGPDDFYDAVRSKNVDMVMMGHHLFWDERFNYIKNNLIIPLDLKNIPNFKHVIPALQKAKHLYRDGKVYASPVSQGPYGLAYNTARLKEEPQSWNILWDPRFKGKYVISANDPIYNSNITALALGYPKEDISNYNRLNNTSFRKKLRQLAVNAHSFWIGVDKPEDLSGMILATSWGDSLGALNKRGEPWKMAEPAEGMPCWIDNYAITWALADKLFLKKIAEAYINYLLSTEYQVNHIMRHMSLTPIITNIDNLLTAEEKERIHIWSPNFFDKNRILQRTCSTRDRNGLGLLWKEAMKGLRIEKGDN
ncbi:MAG: extracellular solute-binding protein [Desulfobacteraceae bacterium]|nr:extracellular solute-binding protein [Desulfobacteraceae bacterium]